MYTESSEGLDLSRRHVSRCCVQSFTRVQYVHACTAGNDNETDMEDEYLARREQKLQQKTSQEYKKKML